MKHSEKIWLGVLAVVIMLMMYEPQAGSPESRHMWWFVVVVLFFGIARAFLLRLVQARLSSKSASRSP